MIVCYDAYKSTVVLTSDTIIEPFVIESNRVELCYDSFVIFTSELSVGFILDIIFSNHHNCCQTSHVFANSWHLYMNAS